MDYVGPHGSARWAETGDLKRFDMFGDRGMILGKFEDRWITKGRGESHILTLAPPESGKTTSLIVPTLLTYDGSVVVTDPKGALAPITAEARRKMGQKIVMLCPWAEELTAAVDGAYRYHDDGFNPFGGLKEGPSLYDDAKAIAELLNPNPPKGDISWAEIGRTILTGCMVLLVREQGSATPADLADIVRSNFDEVAARMEKAGMADTAAEIINYRESEKQWTGYYAQLTGATDIFRRASVLGAHVSKGGFDPADLKRSAVTVYIIVPSNRRAANERWLQLVVGALGQAVGAPGLAREVLFLLEEFQNLGQLKQMSEFMAQYREAGLRAWLIVQSINALEDRYGRDGTNALLDVCRIRQYFSVSQLDVTERLSREIGSFTERKPAFGPRWWEERGQARSVPLLRPEDIARLPVTKQIILRANDCPPIMADLVPYYRDRDLHTAAGPNPFRGPVKEPFKAGRRFFGSLFGGSR